MYCVHGYCRGSSDRRMGQAQEDATGFDWGLNASESTLPLRVDLKQLCAAWALRDRLRTTLRIFRHVQAIPVGSFFLIGRPPNNQHNYANEGKEQYLPPPPSAA